MVRKIEMFDYCQIGNKKCAFCGISNNVKYCGLSRDENKIEKMKLCPQNKKKKGK
jgi:hypothetical protein